MQETAYRDSARVEEAMAIYSQVEEIQPYNHIPNYNKGYIYMEYKNELDSASFEFAQVIQKNPASFQSYYNQGLIYERKGLYRDALDQMEISLQIDPTFTLAALAKERILENLSE